MFAILPLFLAAAAPAAADALPVKLEAMSRAGNAEASYHLGMLYHLGLRRLKDPARAFKLFVQASDGGDALGAYKVGCYYAGQSEGTVPNDAAKALRYTMIAANAGYDLAEFDVAVHYLNNQRNAEALPWLIKAAQQGNRESFVQIMRISLDRNGGTHDLARAYEYYRSALALMKAHGAPVPTSEPAKIFEHLTAAQRIEADRRAASFTEKPTAITLRARAGLEAADALARSS